MVWLRLALLLSWTVLRVTSFLIPWRIIESKHLARTYRVSSFALTIVKKYLFEFSIGLYSSISDTNRSSVWTCMNLYPLSSWFKCYITLLMIKSSFFDSSLVIGISLLSHICSDAVNKRDTDLNERTKIGSVHKQKDWPNTRVPTH